MLCSSAAVQQGNMQRVKWVRQTWAIRLSGTGNKCAARYDLRVESKTPVGYSHLCVLRAKQNCHKIAAPSVYRGRVTSKQQRSVVRCAAFNEKTCKSSAERSARLCQGAHTTPGMVQPCVNKCVTPSTACLHAACGGVHTSGPP